MRVVVVETAHKTHINDTLVLHYCTINDLAARLKPDRSSVLASTGSLFNKDTARYPKKRWPVVVRVAGGRKNLSCLVTCSQLRASAKVSKREASSEGSPLT